MQILTPELYKVRENVSHEIMNPVFSSRVAKYNLRTQAELFTNMVDKFITIFC